MSFDAKQFRSVIIQPTLARMGAAYEGLNVEQLLMGTSAQETFLGRYLKQIVGPARGVYQVEPATNRDQWDRSILKNPQWLSICQGYVGPRYGAIGIAEPAISLMTENLGYATVIARLFYRRVPEALPPADDLRAQYNYYKKYWNTSQGAATWEQYKKHWESYAASAF